MSNKLNLYDELKALGSFSLDFHDDADGVYSASLLMLANGLNVKKIRASHGDERFDVGSPCFNCYTRDVAVDLGSPSDPNWKGIAIDHHPDHPLDRKYKLFWGGVPTGLIIWNEMKDYIPKKHWWRVAGSLMGDSSIEYLPAEIWDEFPCLWDEKGSVYRDQHWNVKFSQYPIYIFLSSGINKACRLGNPLQALNMCLKWNTPYDAVTDPEVADVSKLIDVEERNIMNAKPLVEIYNHKYALIKIKTTRPEFSMSGYIASQLQGQYKFHTIIVLNESNGEVSIRGTLARYVADKLRASGFKAGGHAVACGATVPLEHLDDFIAVIRNIK